MDVDEVVIQNLRTGVLAPRPLRALVLDLSRFQARGRIDGILGMDIVDGRSFLFDVRNGCIDVDADAASVSGGTSIPSSAVAGRVVVRIGGMNFVLDSAASCTTLMSRRAAGLLSMDAITQLTAAGGSSRARAGVIPHLQIGHLRMRDLPAIVMPNGRDAREDALLPLKLFTSVFVAADRRSVIIK